MNICLKAFAGITFLLGGMCVFSEVPSTMYEFRRAIVELQPEIASKEYFLKKENEKQIGQKLKLFTELVTQLKKHERLDGLGFKVPAENIRENMNESLKAFSADKKSLSWMRLRAAVYGCNQCHMQVGGKQAPAWGLDQKTLSSDTFTLAETWYLFRDYHRAMEFYLSVISKFGSDHVTFDQLATSLSRVLSITLRIERSPKKARDILSSARGSDQMPLPLKKNVSLWLDELDRMKTLTVPNVETASAGEIDTFTDTLLRQVYPIMAHPGSRKASALLASGLLLEFVNTREKEVLPRMLYWLGVSLRDTDDALFATSSEHYLTACVKKFHADPVASACYKDLKNQIHDDYTGSQGTEIPKDVQIKLDELFRELPK